MAFRTWGRVLLTSLGVSLMAGAGQLGVAYGLGLVRFGRVFTDSVQNQWNAQLTWIAWIAVTAAVTGALAADRAARRLGHDGGLPALAGIAVTSSTGAAAVALITMPAARTAQLTGAADPVTAAGVAAVLGAVAGLPLAALALWQRPYAWTLLTTVAAAWLLAIGSSVPAFGPVRLGVLDPAALSTGIVQRLAVVVMPALALITGAVAGTIARRLTHHPVIVATCGLLGPAPFATAYLIAGPGGAADTYQAAPYWGALVATAAGALGSMLATVVPRSGDDAPTHHDQEPSGVRPEPADPPAVPPGPGPETPRTHGSKAASTGTGTSGSVPGRPTTGAGTTRAPAPDAIPDPVRREPSDTGTGAHDTVRTSANPRDPRTPISSIGSTGTDDPVSTETGHLREARPPGKEGR